jgi:hypothetical protein
MNPTPLTDAALARLRALASQNGATSEIIQLVSTEERVAELTGTMALTPQLETQGARHAGPPQGRKTRSFGSFAELQGYIAKQQQDFAAKPTWFDSIKPDLDKMPGQGWGSDNLRFELDERTENLAATERCPQCQGGGNMTCENCSGRKTFACNRCHASGQEQCANCFGNGLQPNGNGQACVICQGRRFVSCHQCQGRGQTLCPSCRGSGGIKCQPCNGTGSITEQVKLTYGAELAFRTNSGTDLPPAIRRAMDRAGITMLTRGHADISYIREPDDEDRPANKVQLHYTASLPVAEMVLAIRGKKCRITAFGKRQALLEVPTFLDSVLKDARMALADAAAGRVDLDGARKAKLIDDGLQLLLAGQRSDRDLLRQYPVGLSAKTAHEIMTNLVIALKQLTLKARVITASGCVIAAVLIFGLLFYSPLLNDLDLPLRLALELLTPILLMSLTWYAVAHASRIALANNFGKEQKIKQPLAGKIGIGAAAIVLLFYFTQAMLGGMKPVWLEWLINFLPLQ